MAHIFYSLVVCPSGEMKRNSVQDLPRLEATSLRASRCFHQRKRVIYIYFHGGLPIQFM